MRFRHSRDVWDAHPTLSAGVIHATGITNTPDVGERLGPYLTTARKRLDAQSVSEFPEIQAWRRAFAAMGLKPTQYRCAAEALLRRLGKGGELPRIHPLVDLCNHVSASHAIPVAALDLHRVAGDLEVRAASGAEQYATFSGEVEHPAPGEIIFADDAGHAHARRWTNRQSAASAIRDTTGEVLIVIEALHHDAESDVRTVVAALGAELSDIWGVVPSTAILSARDPLFSAAFL